MPYAYVLGVFDKWIKKFDTISEAPSWYDSSKIFNITNFELFINSFMKVAEDTLLSNLSSDEK